MDNNFNDNNEIYQSSDSQGITLTIIYTIVLTAVMWGVSSYIN